MRKAFIYALLTSVAIFAQVNTAQAQQTLNFSLGYFTPLGRDARVEDDVLTVNQTFLVFDVKDFNGASIGAEWLVPLSNYVEGGLGIGFSRRTVPSVYQDFIDSDGTEIEQDLKLRIVPVTATVKFLPIGRAGDFQPYIGGGIALLNWKYSEVGEFVDFSDNSIFRDVYVASGNTIAPLVFGGLRVPVSGDVFAINAEFRYQGGKGDTSGTGLLADKIDLGGYSFIGSFQIRF